jgi:ribosomal protein S12 methylthiotransferase
VPSYWVETLGCPKNEVDSDVIEGSLRADGLERAGSADEADLVVVNTCAFVEAAREESVSVVLDLADRRRDGARLVVTGCMAERYGGELADALPEVDAVVGFAGQVALGGGHDTGAAAAATSVAAPVRRRSGADGPAVPSTPALDLSHVLRGPSSTPWAYVKVAEGCDKACGFCAIPSFRGPQRSRPIDDVLAEVDRLQIREAVLVAQDLAAYGRDRTAAEPGGRRIVELVRAVSAQVPWVRLLYLYPSELTDELLELVAGGPVPYFDLSLQHVSAPLVRAMRRWGDGDRFLERIERIRSLRPDAALRSNFIVGYPGETEEDHLELLGFLEAARLDWCGFFAYSPEDGTHAAGLDGRVDDELVRLRLRELGEVQDRITAERRDALVGTRVEVLVDAPGRARSHREAPEIDGVIHVPATLEVGGFHRVRVTAAEGPDLRAEP